MMILVIAEQRDGVLNPASWEAIAVAQETASSVRVAVAGDNLASVAEELASADVENVILLEHPALATYTADGFVTVFADLIQTTAPELVFLAHTYQTREFAPRMAARLERPPITDCVAVKRRDGRLAFVLPMFQGKFVADVAAIGSAPHFVSFQIGAFRADSVRKGAQAAPIETSTVSLDPAAIRQSVEPPFQEAKQAVDLTQAERIVSVGRGIKAEEHIALVQQLASALGAEVAASRPICDSGWLPMDRQIGSSGQTVAPKLYLALGISGAIQHLVGMKGSQTIVAINKDADAPIFEVADFGVVGDLFDVVPAIIAALEA